MIHLEPSIGNHDEEFLYKWYDKLQNFSLELMGDIVAFCKRTITDINGKIQDADKSLREKMRPAQYQEIRKTLPKNKEDTAKTLKFCKEKNSETSNIRKPEDLSNPRWVFSQITISRRKTTETTFATSFPIT